MKRKPWKNLSKHHNGPDKTYQQGAQTTMFDKGKKEEPKEERKIDDKVAEQKIQELLLKQKIAISYGLPEKFEKPITYCLTKQGVFEVRKNKIGYFTSKVEKCESFPDTQMKDGFNLDVPKIPIELLHQTIGFFKAVNEKHSSEAYIQIFYNTEKEEYFIHVPEQIVNSVHVDYEHTKDVDEKPENLLVMDIHSHNTMGAFWSGTDDKDEQRDQFYGVIGKITQKQPEMKFRFSCGGKHVDIETEDIFVITEESFEFPEKWMEQLKEKKWLTGEHTSYIGEYSCGGSNIEDNISRMHQRYSDPHHRNDDEWDWNDTHWIDNTPHYHPIDTKEGKQQRDMLDNIMDRYNGSIHRMSDDEFEKEHGLIGMDDEPFENIENIADELVDRPKEDWIKLLDMLMHEDSKFVNEFINQYNHHRKNGYGTKL